MVFGRAAGRPDERIAVVTLAEAEAGDGRHGDLRHRRVGGDPDRGARGLPPLVYTPRFAARAAR